ncbi:MAG: transcriptional regulator [Fusobacteria bacterium]|nr:transcriptional regulator [Fusobacteriota bacterium]
MLSDVLHQPIRTQVMAFLVNVEEADFKTIKNQLSLTDGHMTTHMKVLVNNNYVVVEKLFVDNKPKTIYKITSEGKAAFLEYVQALRNLIEQE